jgi:hypothetical protein
MRATSAFATDRQLAQLAREQLGLVSAQQAVGLGIRPSLLEHRARAGVFIRLFPNIYADLSVMATPDQRILAAWLAVSDAQVSVDVSISGRSAAFVHGLPIPVHNLSLVDLVSSHDRRFRIAGLKVRRSRYKPKTDPWLGARITTPAQTICDLAGALSLDSLARCVDHVVAHRTATVSAISQIALARPAAGFHGRRKLLTVVDARSDGRLLHRSGLEQLVKKWLNDAGLGAACPNFVIADADDLEVDFAWSWARLGLELSPFHTHGSEEKQRRDMQRRRIATLAGWAIVEASDADLVSAKTFEPIVAMLREMLARASVIGQQAAGERRM